MCMAGWLDGLGGWYCLGVGVVFGGGGMVTESCETALLC